MRERENAAAHWCRCVGAECGAAGTAGGRDQPGDEEEEEERVARQSGGSGCRSPSSSLAADGLRKMFLSSPLPHSCPWLGGGATSWNTESFSVSLTRAWDEAVVAQCTLGIEPTTFSLRMKVLLFTLNT